MMYIYMYDETAWIIYMHSMMAVRLSISPLIEGNFPVTHIYSIENMVVSTVSVFGVKCIEVYLRTNTCICDLYF